MPPTSRTPDRTQPAASASASANRSRMYNLAGHAHSSGSLLPRSTDVHAASSSAATSAAPARTVDATDAPYLTNLESHFGRVTLTAPDNLLRKQAKQTKQKIRQTKAQHAHAAAVALARTTQSSSNLLDSSRRYQSTLQDAPVSTRLLLSTPAQHVVIRRAYSGNHTPTLASTSHLQTPPPSNSHPTATRMRTRPPSAARDDASRPASRASATSRPESALSFNDHHPPQPQPQPQPQPHASTSDRFQQPGPERPSRSRTESAPEPQRRSHNAFAPTPNEVDTNAAAQVSVPSSNTALQTSLHRQNVWNDITEADPDDLPPPFPEGAPRPPTPPRPPSHSEAANHEQLIAPQPHVRIPHSPPPPFVSDDDEPTPANGDASRTNSASSHPAAQPTHSSAEQHAPDTTPPSSRASTPSSESSRDGESIAPTEERRAWEADIRNGLSFEVRLLREQQRRVARERAVALQAASSQQHLSSAEAFTAESEVVQRAQEEAIHVQHRVTAPREAAETPAVDTLAPESSSARPATQDEVAEPQTAPQTSDDRQRAELPPEPQSPPSAAAAEPASSDAPIAMPTQEARTSSPITTPPCPLTSSPLTEQPSIAIAVTAETNSDGRLWLANEPRLGLPPMPHTSAAASPSIRISSHVAAHRRPEGFMARGHDSDSHLPLSRRPEDTLYVISAPPPATHARSSSGDEEVAPPSHQPDVGIAATQDDVADGASSVHSATDDDDDAGAESDSSIEQWLAEAAAFDALRKREEEAAARLQALREPPVSDSDVDDDDDDDDDDDAAMPGAFSHRPSPHRNQPSIAARKVPDPANLALMDQALPKAPPPLVLGRSRGGAAYSDSSSESTDTDDALDLYSSSDEDDEQHRAFQHASMAEPQRKENDPFVNSHKSVHARNTSSAPNLTTLGDSQGESSSKTMTAACAAVSAHRAHEPLRQSKEAHALPLTPGQIQPANPQVSRSNVPGRSLSLRAQGKLPERNSAASAPQQPDTRAGDFEEDTSSSRDLSDTEERPPSSSQPPSSIPASAPVSSSNLSHRNSVASLPLPPQDTSKRTTRDPLLQPLGYASLDPLLQPLGYGPYARTDLGNRLKGLFGQPLVANSASAQANTPGAPTPTTQPLSTNAETPVSQEGSSSRDCSASVAPSGGSSLRSLPSAGSGSHAAQSSSADVTKASPCSTVPPEQKARDEALAQIAQLSATTQSRQESLAALERLLAKTRRPTSMMPPSTMTRAELGGRLQLASDVSAAETDKEEALDASEQSSAVDAPPASNRLSREGAIVRGRPSAGTKGPLPPPPSALSRTASSSNRPVSFVNPRSFAAPMPRGRLPAITDATRHFPPSASSTGPSVAPSWLSYIPSEERERLQTPLEPQRVNSVPAARAPGSRVSAMISRFEAPAMPPQEQHRGRSPSSPTKQSAPFSSGGGVSGSSSNLSHVAEAESTGHVEERAEPAVFRRFSRNERSDAPGDERIAQRRPPPPPPSVPRRVDTNPFRRLEMCDRPTSTGPGFTQSASMEALAGQIEEAATEWSTASLHGSADQREANQGASGSRLAVPTTDLTSETTSSGGSSSALPRSPRTQALDTLTGRQHDAGAVTPAVLPPKSPLITPEQILAGSSRNGLSASIAAAQAAAFARHNSRESRTHSASSSMDTSIRETDTRSRNDWREADGGCGSVSQGSRRLATVRCSVRSNQGLGMSGEVDFSPSRGMPVPPPLPTRPRDRNWNNCVGNGSETTRTRVETSTTNPRPPPNDATSACPQSDASWSMRAPQREASLGITDLELLVAQLERSGSHFESLCAIGEFLGPAKPTAATAEQLASLSVGVVECESRRVTREGKIKQKLSCVGVRVDKCAICLVQFREAQRAVILPCGHIFHEQCTVDLLKRITTCPTCRAPAV